jgi:flagellar motor protein MotB
MILLAFFASQYSDDDNVPRTSYEKVVNERNSALQTIGVLQEKLRNLEKELVDEKNKNKVLENKIDSLNKEIIRLKEEIKRLRQSKKQDPLEEYLLQSANERKRILEKLRSQLKIDFPNLDVIISEQSDALRFQGDGLFQVGSSALSSDKRVIIESIANRLNEILPCYTIGDKASRAPDCNSSYAVIEAVQIEGHTDSSGFEVPNLLLSTDRANSTFIAMISKAPDLLKHLNTRGQPVLSVAGYGQMRPISSNDTETGRSTNRRIDLRLIMYTPSRAEEIESIRHKLNKSSIPVRIQ